MNRSVLIVLSLIVVVVLASGNFYVDRIGIIENAVTDSTKTVRADAFVSKETEFEEFARILFDFGKQVTFHDLRQLQNFHKVLSDSGLTVASIATHPDFEYKDNTLTSRKLIPDDSSSFSVKEWKERVKSNEGVYGKLVFTDFSHALLLIKMEQGFNEVTAGRKLVEILENRDVPEWGWYLKQDIASENPHVIPGGYILARVTMYGAINATNLWTVSLGLVFAILFLSWFFRAVKPALVASLIIAGTLACTRGSIGYLDLLGYDTAESVYTTLVFASVIIANISFITHTYQGVRYLKENSKESRWWDLMLLIGIVVLLTFLIGFLNFLSLMTFPVTVIADLGVHTAVGIFFALISSLVLFPAIAGGMITKRKQQTAQPLEELSVCLRQICQKIPATLSLGVIVVTVSIAGWGIWNGQLPIGSQPLQFIRGTSVYSASEKMNANGQPGFITLGFAFKPNSGTLRDPANIASFHEFLQEVRSVEGVRRAYSLMDDVTHISREVFSKPIPETQGEVDFVFRNGIESTDSYWKLQEQLESISMWRFTVTTSREGRRQGQVRDRVVNLAESQSYSVYPFGRNSLYPDIDQAIIEGKPRNAMMGHGIVILVVTFWLLWRLRNGRALIHLTRLSFLGAVVASLPFVFASAVLVITMIELSIPLDIATAVITALSINASVDFTLYYVHVYLMGVEEGVDEPLAHAFEVEGAAITADMIANSLCFAVLIASPFQPVQQLGIIMVLMLITAWVGALILMPPVLSALFSKSKDPQSV